MLLLVSDRLQSNIIVPLSSSQLVLEYVDENRDDLLATYDEFGKFRDDFDLNKDFMDEFFAYIEEERGEQA